jgi:hypothetical protein
VQNATVSCRFQKLLPFLSVIYFSCHASPPTIPPSSLTLSYHLFRGLPLGLVDSNFMYNTLLEILFSSILCTCPNQHNLCSHETNLMHYLSSFYSVTLAMWYTCFGLASCPSSGGNNVYMRQLARRKSTKAYNTYQLSHIYIVTSWWWATSKLEICRSIVTE